MPDTTTPAKRNVAELTVSELAFDIKRTLEDGYGHVRIRGEVFGYRGPHSSGHCYFSLKDDKAKIDAVIWKGIFNALRFKPEDGMEVIATGKVTTYPGSSKYQIVVEALEPAGAGALMALLEERKRKLAAEGLFDEARKQRLPFLPRVVGIITSPTGAVIRDMLAVFSGRFPAHVIVWPVRVQGETSAAEVAAAIAGFNAIAPGGPVPRPDVLIVARGGGSLEDLWGFNEEIVVRAVAASAIPLVSAVGHETDWTLIDLAADLRAPTPTKAAESVVPQHSDLVERVGENSLRLQTAGRRMLERQRHSLTGLARALPRPRDLVQLPRQRFDTAAGRLSRALAANTGIHKTRFVRLTGRLNPRLLAARLARARDRLTALSRAEGRGYLAVTTARRARLERVTARLTPQTVRLDVRRGGERLRQGKQRLDLAMRTIVDRRRRRLEAQTQVLQSLSYESALRRGYAIVRTTAGAVIRSVAQVAAGADLSVQLADGNFAATAKNPGGPVFGAGAGGDRNDDRPQPRPRPPAKPAGKDQGNLF